MNAQEGRSPWSAFIEPNRFLGKEAAEDLDEVLGPETEPHERFLKVAQDAGGLYVQDIPVDAFNRVIWQDPNTSLPLRAATTGLVEAASQSRGGIELISPYDIARVAVGMGSGLASGMLVGKALGALAGLTPGAQDTLKRTGMWAGALANLVPKAFGM
jgi:hypothetical protein